MYSLDVFSVNRLTRSAGELRVAIPVPVTSAVPIARSPSTSVNLVWNLTTEPETRELDSLA